ncbi:MAG: HipA domain-containing protein [Desulfovibrio sp.]|nr:HipA domain-containing protein [Desulfovibrio sp.]
MPRASKKQFYIFLYPLSLQTAVPAALAHFTQADYLHIAYGNKYRKHEKSVPIDPVLLPLDQSEYLLTEGCYGTIRDASPDYWGRLVIAKMINKDIHDLTEQDFVLYQNCERAGNLDFRESLEAGEPDIEPPMTEYLDILLAAAQNIEKGISIDKRHLMLLAQGTSLGGSRPKCTVIYQGFPWLAKFPSIRDQYSNARVEFATLSLAQKCGINVPPMQLIEIDGIDILLSKRFDRKITDKGISRLGYMSALSLCKTNEHDLFAYSYEKIAGAMTRYCPADRTEFFKRMLFNVLCRNTDDHPRNHGFLIEGETIRLSPAFDIVPTTSTEGISTFVSQAMNVGAYGREGTIENVLSHAALFGLTRQRSQEIVENMLEKFSLWQECFERAGVSEKETELFKNSFETRWKLFTQKKS